jgi:hypothetical protein
MLSFKLEVPVGSPIRRLGHYLAERQGRIIGGLIGGSVILVWGFVIMATDDSPWYAWLLFTGIWAFIAVTMGIPFMLVLTDKVFPLNDKTQADTTAQADANRQR